MTAFRLPFHSVDFAGSETVKAIGTDIRFVKRRTHLQPYRQIQATALFWLPDFIRFYEDPSLLDHCSYRNMGTITSWCIKVPLSRSYGVVEEVGQFHNSSSSSGVHLH
jgi:hypothetical protein